MAELAPPAPGGPHGVVRVAFEVGRVLALVVAVPSLVAVATGWLYWVRDPVASWPGPRVQDALPLDELPGHDTVPLLAFALVFLLAGALIGLLCRGLRITRVSATLSTGLGVAAALLVVDTFSVYVVRQVPIGTALHAAVRLPPIFIAALLTGAAGGVLGRAGARAEAWTRLIAWIVAVGGFVDLLSAALPHTAGHGGFLYEAAPVSGTPLVDVLMVPVGALLLVTARGLSRGRHPAYLMALALLTASTVLHLAERHGVELAAIPGLIGLVVLARRQDFTSPPGPRSGALALARAATVVATVFGFGVVTLVAASAVAGLPFDPAAAVGDTARALVGIAPSKAHYLPYSFGSWFPWSVMGMAAAGVLWAVEGWVAPWRPRFSEDGRRRQWAAAIVRRWGADTLAPFALGHDKALFFYGGSGADGRFEGRPADVVIAYRVVRGVALVSGDPIGPPSLKGPAIREFLDFAHQKGWRVAVLGASDRLLGAYRHAGLHALHHGDEAVIEVGSFSLEGGAKRAVRQAVTRLNRKGYVCEIHFAGELSPELRRDLAEVERLWLRGRPRKGFSMELDDLFRLGGHDALFVVGRSPDGRVAGFLHLALCPAGGSLSLSSMPRLDDIPNGLTSWLIVETVRWAAAHCYEYVSLNFSPFGSLLTTEAPLSVVGRAERRLLLALKAALSLQLDNLQRFNHQFGPIAQHRFVVYEHRTDLPLVALAAMAAEGYLPFSDRLRGRNWTVHAIEKPEGGGAEDETGQASGPIRERAGA
jgi:lysyl-tRNA synthetase, class II